MYEKIITNVEVLQKISHINIFHRVSSLVRPQYHLKAKSRNSEGQKQQLTDTLQLINTFCSTSGKVKHIFNENIH